MTSKKRQDEVRQWTGGEGRGGKGEKNTSQGKVKDIRKNLSSSALLFSHSEYFEKTPMILDMTSELAILITRERVRKYQDQAPRFKHGVQDPKNPKRATKNQTKTNIQPKVEKPRPRPGRTNAKTNKDQG